MIALSEKQKEIINFDKGALLVKAGAGSGKTRVLTERIKILLNKTKRKILAITFTNKAGEEIKERLKDVSLLSNKLFIGTFHSFCEYVLQNHGKSIGINEFPIIFDDKTDRLKLAEEAIKQTPSYYLKYLKYDGKKQEVFKNRALSFISEVKRELLTEEDIYNKRNDEDMILFYKTYQDILSSQNAIDFDDILLLTYKLFTEFPSITSLYKKSFEYILVDEAQDLNKIQYYLLKLLINETNNIMMVGDSNQSIFVFNGSSPDFMNKYFIDDYNPDIFELYENYRSSVKILQLAEQIIPISDKQANLTIQGIFELNKFENEETEALWILNEIKSLIDLKIHRDIEGEITYQKIAILARNKYVFNYLEKLLESENIPFYYKLPADNIQFESDIMQIFDLAFKIKINPKDDLHWQKLCSFLKYNNEGKIKDLNILIKLNLVKKTENIIKLVIDLNDDGSNFKVLLEKYKEIIIIDKNNEDETEYKMIIDDIDELLRHWGVFSKTNEDKSLYRFRNAVSLGKTNNLEFSKTGITLSTVHTMKGQEYDIIFLMGMDNETFPDYRAIKNNGIELIQEKNNLYVAITRAKRFLFVTWPESRNMPWNSNSRRKISMFLENIKI